VTPCSNICGRVAQQRTGNWCVRPATNDCDSRHSQQGYLRVRSIQEHDVALQTREFSTGNTSAGDASGSAGHMRVWYACNGSTHPAMRHDGYAYATVQHTRATCDPVLLSDVCREAGPGFSLVGSQQQRGRRGSSARCCNTPNSVDHGNRRTGGAIYPIIWFCPPSVPLHFSNLTKCSWGSHSVLTCILFGQTSQLSFTRQRRMS
jgi:hypothetical protein